MDEKLVSIAAYSERIGVSKQAVYSKVKSLELTLNKLNGEAVLDATQVELLDKSFEKTRRRRERKENAKSPDTKVDETKVPVEDVNIIAVLQAELEQKNQEINNLQKLLEQQQQLLYNQQQLSLVAENKIKMLEAAIGNPDSSAPDECDVKVPDDLNEEQKKVSLFSRLFSRKKNK